jgi:hypothetical protein
LFLAESGAANDRRSFKGGAFSVQLAMGGHVTPFVTLGGAYLRDQIFHLSVSDAVTDGDEPSLKGLTFSLNSVCFFGDFAVRTLPGLHLTGFVGYGVLSVEGRPSGGSSVDDPSGFLLAGAAAYEFRVADSASIGAALRVSWAQLNVTEANGTDVDVFVPALLLTARLD